MKSSNDNLAARIVEIVETWDGAPGRTFYGIYDPEFGHWMSTAAFDGLIWTRDCRRRCEFDSRSDADDELKRFIRWRNGEEDEDGVLEIPCRRGTI